MTKQAVFEALAVVCVSSGFVLAAYTCAVI